MMFHTSNIIWQSVTLTDEVKINLQYDIDQGLLNIFVKNLPCHINVLSEDQPKICYEISTTYSYDISDDDEQIDSNRTLIISSSSSSSSCSDEQILDNDDGYSTHSHDDTEQQQLSLVIPSTKSLRSSFSSHHYYYSEQSPLSIRRLIEQMTWLNPFKKSIQQMMMMNHLFA